MLWDFPLGLSKTAHRAGDKVKALKAEISIDMAIVTANCLNSVPVIPSSKREGRNTAASTKAMAITGPETSCMAANEAMRGFIPLSMCSCTASTTTMASSTTRPIASTIPNREIVLSENPSSGNMQNVEINDTGTAISGIRVARQFWRKMNTTNATRMMASISVCLISSIE